MFLPPACSALLLPEPVSDTSPVEIVGTELHLNLVARQNPNVVHSHPARNVGQNVVPVVEFHPELRVGQRLRDGPLNLYDVFFSQGPPLLSQVTKRPEPNLYVTTRITRLPPQDHRNFALVTPLEPASCRLATPESLS